MKADDLMRELAALDSEGMEADSLREQIYELWHAMSRDEQLELQRLSASLGYTRANLQIAPACPHCGTQLIRLTASERFCRNCLTCHPVTPPSPSAADWAGSGAPPPADSPPPSASPPSPRQTPG